VIGAELQYEPMLKMHEIEGVIRFDTARTLLGRGRYWTTCYLVDGLMIDTGCAHAARELESAVAPFRVDQILNTHTHEDHIGANGRLQKANPDLSIRAHELALPILADPRGRQPLHPYRKVMWGWPEPCTARAIDDGDHVRTTSHRFEVLYTPGHAADHLCLFEPDRGWLFTGDLYVGGRDRALRAGYDIWGIIDSLKRVRALEPRLMFPGSARVRENPSSALDEKIDHLETLGARVLELDGRGWSERRIVRELMGPPMWIEAITLTHFARFRLVRSYLGRNGETTHD
jgi:glyoxylase-like metal-dependent hydrolase (beta-lactamase superfamily II)